MMTSCYDVCDIFFVHFPEPDGLRQVSPESPVKPMVGYRVPKKSSTASVEAAEHAASIRLSLPPVRIRRTSEPHPRCVQFSTVHFSVCQHVMSFARECVQLWLESPQGQGKSNPLRNRTIVYLFPMW